MPHHILLLGATGPSGLTFAETALASGHNLTIFARNPSKLPASIQSNQNVKVIEGGFSDEKKVKGALNTDATILISFLGPSIPVQENHQPVTEFYGKILYPTLCSLKKSGESKISRILICSTPSFSYPEDSSSLKWLFCTSLIRIFFPAAWLEVRGIGRVTTELNLDEVEWTVFRVPVLKHGEAKGTRAVYVGEKGDGVILGRRSLAVWLLQEVEERRWVGGCPAISEVGWI